MITEILKLGNNIIDKIIPDKEKAQEAKIKLLELQQNGEFKDDEMRYNSIIQEAKSKDKWTSRARPSFLYVMYIFILFSIPFGLLFAFSEEVALNITQGIKMYLEAIPDTLYNTFLMGYLGYSGFRTIDKIKKK